jgi:carboxymethylenebutenolidase
MLETVRLKSGMTCLIGRPSTREKRPAVIMLHERYGIVEHTREMTERLAAEGFVGFAPDLFHRFTGDREALRSTRPGPRVCNIIDDESVTDLAEACAYLRTLSYVDGERIACIGACQTGRQPLVYSAQRNDLAAAVVFHGGVYPRDLEPDAYNPVTIDNYLPRLSCPVLGLFGELDKLVPVGNVLRFRKHLEEARRSYQIRLFAGTPHAWLDKAMPGDHDPGIEKETWRVLTSFLGDCFSGKWDRSRVLWRYESDTSPNLDFSKFTPMT